ncbi:MAG: putative metal-binding motif-containing protein [Deltaproteobacteria bacterium]|nr:putative metal-binding motif-containing protein [Deltaproteobacteria bacterium]
MRILTLTLLSLALLGCRTKEELPDLDGDGYTTLTDCDDGDPSVYPDADEVCDGLDNNCDGLVDDDAVDRGLFYADEDGDGYGAADTEVAACAAPEGFVAEGGDCDDTSAAAAPGGEEVCDGLDNDCDGLVDDDATDAGRWYADADGDGYGGQLSADACEAPEGFVAEGGDCDDASARVHPGAAEDDCADPVDYNCDGSVGYEDGDGDGWAACEDCDDTSASAHPGGTEICDGLDNDCDMATDEEALGAPTWYADTDGDGFGAPGTAVVACEAPQGYTASEDDCDDRSAAVHPGAAEVCNGIDDDCDEDVDQDALDAPSWYADTDEDGFAGSHFTVVACEAPAGYLAAPTDCDDLDPLTFPGAPEQCDGALNDCDGALPEDELDGDGDGFMGCEGDCDDDAAAAFPGGTEVCDGLDNDCDGTPDEHAADASPWYADGDGDGQGAGAATRACEAPGGMVAAATDCDDSDSAVFSGAAEVCNGHDDDCDGVVDLDATDKRTWYMDLDGDGEGNARFSLEQCEAPAGYVAGSADCDDSDPLRYGGNDEVCDHVDNDCDLEVDEDDAVDAPTWFLDGDGDLDGDPSTGAVSCWGEEGMVTAGADCDDADPSAYTGAVEIWYDGLVQDCAVSNDLDQDGDGYESVRHGGTDCDDTDPTVDEVCPLGTGADGTLLADRAGQVVNRYGGLIADAAAGTSTLSVSVSDLVLPGDELLLHQTRGPTAGLWEYARATGVSGDVITLSAPLVNSYDTLDEARAQVVFVPNYLDVTVPAGTSLVPAPWDGDSGGILALRALGEVRVQGDLDASQRGFRGVPRSSANDHPGYQGEGTEGAWEYDRAANGNGGGGGERNGCEWYWGGAGGGGGHATAGARGSNAGDPCQLGGEGGLAVGTPEQEELFFGGGGAQGAADEDGYGSGGATGGGILVLAADTLVVDGGRIQSNGQGGAGEYNFVGCGSGGGGGAAGGAILIEADAVDLGSSRVFAVGGAGGDTSGNCGTAGGAGAEGRVTVLGASSLIGDSTPGLTEVP